jgi:hypothetical protein
VRYFASAPSRSVTSHSSASLVVMTGADSEIDAARDFGICQGRQRDEACPVAIGLTKEQQLALIYRHTHRDSRGKLNGERSQRPPPASV